MSNLKIRPQSKCGYCGWILFGSRLQAHGCFGEYDEEEDVIVVDDNGIITMRSISSDRSSANHLSVSLRERGVWMDSDDEQLINIVELKVGLWDHRIHASQRTSLKKDALWSEVCNMLGGEITINAVKKRWQYMRDCYMKAHKRMNLYVPSGSNAADGHPSQSGFRFYNRMQFLGDLVIPEPSTSSLPNVQNQTQISSFSLSPANDNVDNNIEPAEHSPQTHHTPPGSEINLANINQHSRSTTSSGSSAGPSRSRKRPSADHTSELEAEFLKYFKEAQPKRDAVDGFLDQLGEILRKLPYVERRNFQLRILMQAAEEEDKLTE